MSRPRGMAALLAAAVAAFPAAEARARTVELRGIDAIKALYRTRQYEHARLFSCRFLWKDICQPEGLYYLCRSLEKLNDKEQAAVFYHLMLRVLDEDPKCRSHSRTPARKALCQKALQTLGARYRAARNTYAATPRGTFPGPGKVDDLWMTQVRCDLRCLHGLYAWKLVGGRQDLKPDWIHNTQGEMHWSGAKYMPDVHGRRGVLFCIPSKKSKRLSRVLWEGPVRGKFLRIGTRAYGFPYVLNVVVGGKEAASRTIGKDAWADLKIPIDPEAAAREPLTLELVVPEGQRWMEGLFFDYIDFFED